MKTKAERTLHKLGPDRHEPAQKSHSPGGPSESRDLHEDRGAIQSKFGQPKPSVRPVTKELKPCGTERPGRGPAFPPAPTRLLSEHTLDDRARPVRVYLARAKAAAVAIAGSFNNWDAARNPMKRNAEGNWEVSLDLSPGDYEYRFVVDGQWDDDPLAGRHVPNPYGGVNAVLHVHGT